MVVVFAGTEPVELTSDAVTKIVGRDPMAHGNFAADSGDIFQWDDGLAILSRSQGPNLSRLEVKSDAPVRPDMAGLVNHLLHVLPLAKGRKSVMVGLNYKVVILDHLGVAREQFRSLFDEEKVGKYVGYKSTVVGEAKFVTNVLNGKMIITIGEAAFGVEGAIPGIVINSNLTNLVNSRKAAIDSLAKERLGKYESYLNRLVGRIQRAS